MNDNNVLVQRQKKKKKNGKYGCSNKTLATKTKDSPAKLEGGVVEAGALRGQRDANEQTQTLNLQKIRLFVVDRRLRKPDR